MVVLSVAGILLVIPSCPLTSTVQVSPWVVADVGRVLVVMLLCSTFSKNHVYVYCGVTPSGSMESTSMVTTIGVSVNAGLGASEMVGALGMPFTVKSTDVLADKPTLSVAVRTTVWSPKGKTEYSNTVTPFTSVGAVEIEAVSYTHLTLPTIYSV